MSTFIVTGGSSGIGLEIAKTFARAGHNVVLVARDQGRLDLASREIASFGVACETAALDVRDADAVAALIDRLPEVDGVVNNAAGNFAKPTVDLSLNGFRAVVEISLYGTFNFSTAVARRLMAEKKRGAICNIIATYAWTGAPGVAHSAAAKAGMLAFTKSVAREWGPNGIRVNAVAPGFVATDSAVANILSTRGASERMLDMIPLGRFAEAKEIAEAVTFLMSEKADYITGGVLTVDGGRSLGLTMHGQDPAGS
ncbi:SDR family oxidoreductase [Pseudarthrobacter sp. SSS035]|uniref:SDR family oxidoreductase n=1 Tax=Pseudarthrobacter sp. SSS035 TaxID=2931399 RepID=UPI00200C792C|nr:SDR family oxidoreductase [Pseudarthrobacter sp. SSS035]